MHDELGIYSIITVTSWSAKIKKHSQLHQVTFFMLQCIPGWRASCFVWPLIDPETSAQSVTILTILESWVDTNV